MVALDVALAIVYVGVACSCLLVIQPDLKVTALSVPSGLALAAVLLRRRRVLAGILVGGPRAGIPFRSTAPIAIVVAITCALEAVPGARLTSATARTSGP